MSGSRFVDQKQWLHRCSLGWTVLEEGAVVYSTAATLERDRNSVVLELKRPAPKKNWGLELELPEPEKDPCSGERVQRSVVRVRE